MKQIVEKGLLEQGFQLFAFLSTDQARKTERNTGQLSRDKPE